MNKDHDKEYDIYFLNEVSYEALRATTTLLLRVDSSQSGQADTTNPLLIRWQDLRLGLDESKKQVKIYCQENNASSFKGGKDMPLGFLSEDDSKKYIPYLRQGWCKSENGSEDLYEGCVITINTTSQNVAQRIQVAISIKKSKNRESGSQ